jgi:hypothetical protein
MAKLENIIDEYTSIKETNRKHKVEEKKNSQTSNGFYQNFLRLDLLSRTTKGDSTPSRRISAQ